MRVLRSESIKELERKADQYGYSYADMMENAGNAAVAALLKETDVKGKSVTVVCGSGNNGGDGYVVARLLSNEGAFVRLLYLSEPSTETAKYMRQRFSGEVIPFEASYLYETDIIIDAIFGTGLSRAAENEYKAAIEAINSSAAFTVSLDIPSGLFADSNEYTVAVKADMTVTFIGYKLCNMLYPAAECFGNTVLSEINMPKHLYNEVETFGEVITPPAFEKRKPNSHKGNYGTLSLICGSFGMAGAAMLCTKAALKSGVGIAKLSLPAEIYTAVTSFVPEAVCCPYDVNGDMEAVAQKAINGASAVLIGCGLSTEKYADCLLKSVLNNYNGKLIIDADGLNILSQNIEYIKRSGADIIITPHPGEMARLCGVSVSDVESDRVGFAKKLSEELGVTVVLKGSITVVASNDKIYFNLTGNPGMATGGSGDVLAGIIAALCAMGNDSLESAVNGVYVHGCAGDKATECYGEISALPTDTIGFLPEVFKKFGER